MASEFVDTSARIREAALPER
ncbi:hypothetical protein [Pandoraea apista]